MKSNTIPTMEENPKGLHKRYLVQKIVGWRNVHYNDFFEGRCVRTEPVLAEPDPNAEYFVMRLDTDGDDINHIKACRIGIHAYADAIEATIPELAKDLRERYPLLP